MRTAYCFDLDGTLTRQELLPLIASSVGLEDEIEVLTQATIDGFLPFDKSFKLRVRLLRDANLEWIHSACVSRWSWTRISRRSFPRALGNASS